MGLGAMFSHLINVRYEVSGAQEAVNKVKSAEGQISDSMDKITGLKGKMPPLAGIMSGLGFTPEQIASAKAGLNTIKLTTSEVNNLRASLLKAGASEPQVQRLMTTLQSKGIVPPTQQVNDFVMALRRAIIVAPIWMATRFAMQSVFSLIQSQTKFIIDMEDAMARIQIVGKGTPEAFNNLKFSLIGLALAYGTSASEALNAAKIFAQQGKTVAETFSLTRAAMLGAQVLGQDVKTTTEDLTAAMNSFNIPAENAIGIIDKLINVEKQFAVTSIDLSAGIKTVGATANQMGVSLSALSGDITAVIEVTRKSGSEAARGLQFIYTRLLTSAKPLIEQLTGIKFYLDANGKATSSLTGTLRSATDVLDDLASKWGNLGNEQRLQVAESLGSKRQMVIINSLMDNYNRSLDARIASLTSAGSAEKAFNIIQETTSFKLKQLGTSWNALTSAISDTSAFKGAIDGLDAILLRFTYLINFEKGYRIDLAKQSAVQLADVETRQSQIDSIEELIKARTKLASAPPTVENLARLDLVTKALEANTTNYPELKIALTTPDAPELKTNITKIQDDLLKQKIAVRVGIDFAADAGVLQNRLKAIKQITNKKEYTEYELITAKLTAEVYERQKKEIEKQYLLAKAISRINTQDEDAGEDKLEYREELTDAEKEQLNIERQVMNFSMLENATLEEQIQKRIELVTLATKSLLPHARAVELSKLETQLLDARMKKRDEELNKLASISMQYEKLDRTDYAGRRKLERVARLTLMTPEQTAAAYQYSREDKALITEFMPEFSKEAQLAIAKTTEFFRRMNYLIPRPELLSTNPQMINKSAVTQPNMVQVNKAAEAINVIINQKSSVTPEEIAELAKKALLEDKNFQNAFVTKTRPIL